jgi:hypothetical protein
MGDMISGAFILWLFLIIVVIYCVVKSENDNISEHKVEDYIERKEHRVKKYTTENDIEKDK